MKTINLTQDQVALVDDWRYEELSEWKWQAHWDPHTKSFYARRTEGQRAFRKTIFMHRVVANTPDGMICDHINHNTLDCQEHNLRNVTDSQSCMNRRFRSDSQLREKGVSPNRNGYMVQVRKEGKRVFNKYFSTLDEAITARNEAFKKYHGDFSDLSTKED